MYYSDVITSIFKDRLKFTDGEIECVHIERAHCVGKLRIPGDWPKNIVAKMTSQGKSTIMSNTKKLKRDGDGHVKIQGQCPPKSEG